MRYCAAADDLNVSDPLIRAVLFRLPRSHAGVEERVPFQEIAVPAQKNSKRTKITTVCLLQNKLPVKNPVTCQRNKGRGRDRVL